MSTPKKLPQYLMWYDDDPKHPTAAKIVDAVEAYIKSKRWRARPNVVLMSEADLVPISGMENVAVRGVSHIRRNTFWVGHEEAPVEAVEAH